MQGHAPNAWAGLSSPSCSPATAAIGDRAKLKVAHRSASLFVDTAELPAAPQALTDKVAQLRERVAALANVRDTAAKLYELLGPAQRTVFNFAAVIPIGSARPSPCEFVRFDL